MVFGMGRRKGDAAIAEAAALSGAEGVGWAPLPADKGDDKPKPAQPYELRQHSVKSHLKDRATAVVSLRTVVDAPHDVMFDLLADPHQHERIFDAIESASAELVSEEGPVRRWRLDYRARWKFWKVGGVCDNRLWMTTDREQGTVSFVLREPGFLRRYEGTWTITGPTGAGPAAPNAPAASASPVAAAAAAAAATTTTAAAAAAHGAAPHRALWRPLGGSAPSSPRSTAASDACGLPPSRSLSASSMHSASASSKRSLDAGGSRRGSGAAATLEDSPLDTPRAGAWGAPRGAVGLGGFFAAVNNPFTAQPLGRPPAPGAATAAVGGGLGVAGTVGTAPVLRGTGGTATVAVPRWPTTILVHKSISPKVSPPFPLNQVLKGHAAGQVNDMLEGLLAATARRLAEVEGEADQ